MTITAKEKVELIATGYEWICPACYHYHKEIEITEQVTCPNCGKEFYVGDVFHAFGNG